jgi:hypothetical protein
MSEKENPEVLADEELDAVSGGGCCDDEPTKFTTDCERGYFGAIEKSENIISKELCRGCDHFKQTLVEGRRSYTPYWYCDRA